MKSKSNEIVAGEKHQLSEDSTNDQVEREQKQLQV